MVPPSESINRTNLYSVPFYKTIKCKLQTLVFSEPLIVWLAPGTKGDLLVWTRRGTATLLYCDQEIISP